MATISCAISGITFSCNHMDSVHIPHTEGYFHPIFAASHTSLYSCYSKHCKGELTPTDSYLLFLAFLHSSSKICWSHPATLTPGTPSTNKLVENNIKSLVSVLERTNLIAHPSFSQPAFKVTYENSNLEQISHWIGEWDNNIDDFYTGVASMKEQEDLQKTENRLSYLILSGNKPETYAAVIATWADKAASFPPAKAEEWKQIIRSCFNSYKMFSTPLSIIKEISEYCACNIEAGSIHFHSLAAVLKTGITNHIDYLGQTHEISDYTLLPSLGSTSTTDSSEISASLQAIIAKAPSKLPVREDYTSNLEFIRAKLAYRVSLSVSPSPSIIKEGI